MTATKESETVRIAGWRAEQFEGLGFDLSDAALLADSDVDWHEAAKLIAAGCPVDLALRLLT